MSKKRSAVFVFAGLILVGMCFLCDLCAADNVFNNAIQTLQKKGIKEDNDGMLILKRYSYYLSEINKGNAFGHCSITDYKKAPPIYDFIAFSVMAYKGTVDKIVKNTLDGKDAFDGMTGFFERAYLSKVDPKIDSYLIYVPTSYDKSKKYPLVVMLHGSGEDAFLAITTSSHQPFLEACEAQRFIMVAPNAKCHYDDSIKPNEGLSRYINEGEQDVLQVIELVRKKYNIDDKEIYLTGCSMGGFGTWYIGSRHTDLFAAIAPVCGLGTGKCLYSTAVDLSPLKNTPVYAFHGNIDPIVPVTETREMVATLKDMGADVTYEELPGVQHNAWDYAYNNDRLLQWFLKHPKKSD